MTRSADIALSADFSLRIGTLDLAVALEIAGGEVLALLGPNGAGKTTVLRALAGLEPIDSGSIALDGTLLERASPGTGASRTFTAAEDRPVGMVFQNYVLFPHLSVLDNVAFGPRARGVSKRAANDTARRWIDQVGLTARSRSKPSELSGGEAQRVALARALATAPRLLLLDEPLGALDVATRSMVRRDLRKHLGEFQGATVIVTHDPLDAFSLADRVVVLEAGRVTQAATISEITAAPRTPYVAQLLGVNLLRGEGTGHVVRLVGHTGTVTIAESAQGPTLVLIRPNSISLHLQQPDSSARNQWRCTVSGFDLLGDHVRVRLTGEVELVAEITPGAVAELRLVEGTGVWASVKATDVAVYPA